MTERVPVRCLTCHRLEDWGGPEPVVVTPGGARRVDGAPESAAWDVMEAAMAAGGPRIVGRCDQCDQPLVAEASADVERIGWSVTLPTGTLQLGPDLVLGGARGRITASEARRWVLDELRPAPWWRPARPARSLFQAALLTSILGPLTAFLLALLALSIFVGPALDEWSRAAAAAVESLSL